MGESYREFKNAAKKDTGKKKNQNVLTEQTMKH